MGIALSYYLQPKALSPIFEWEEEFEWFRIRHNKSGLYLKAGDDFGDNPKEILRVGEQQYETYKC